MLQVVSSLTIFLSISCLFVFVHVCMTEYDLGIDCCVGKMRFLRWHEIKGFDQIYLQFCFLSQDNCEVGGLAFDGCHSLSKFKGCFDWKSYCGYEETYSEIWKENNRGNEILRKHDFEMNGEIRVFSFFLIMKLQ